MRSERLPSVAAPAGGRDRLSTSSAIPPTHDALGKLAAERGLVVLADAAQSFGASLDGRAAGSLGSLATTSFFPSKPLGLLR